MLNKFLVIVFSLNFFILPYAIADHQSDQNLNNLLKVAAGAAYEQYKEEFEQTEGKLVALNQLEAKLRLAESKADSNINFSLGGIATTAFFLLLPQLYSWTRGEPFGFPTLVSLGVSLTGAVFSIYQGGQLVRRYFFEIPDLKSKIAQAQNEYSAQLEDLRQKIAQLAPTN